MIEKLMKRNEYNHLAKKVRQYDDLEKALQSNEMEALYNLCMNHNRENRAKKQLSAVKPLLQKYGSNNLRNDLGNLAENDGYNQQMIKHLSQEIRRKEWLKTKMSIDEVFDLLHFGDDLTTDIQAGKFDELKEYMLSLGRKKYKDQVSDHVDDELVKFLISKFGGDGNFVKQMSKAKLSGVNDESVSGLESALFRTWHGETELAVWNRLQFGNDALEALTSGKVEIAHKYYTESGSSENYIAIDYFQTSFPIPRVTVALALAKLEPATSEFATMMQHEQIKFWLSKNHDTSVVFDFLKFSRNPMNRFLDVKLEALSFYISLLNPTQPYVKAGDLWDLARLAVGSSIENDPARLLPCDIPLLELLFGKWRSRNIPSDELYEQIHGGKMADADYTDQSVVDEYKNFGKVDGSIVITSVPFPRRS
ncbi:uncharacterized protein PHALS_12787 [Plasmopara halstedii]|uniref:Uncharacterized protein n=1 Tax=Plasmopara halstedii TaxID=4781 RepID=A0A0P1AMT0_PLAHL|nr:uncharacterized protein PHALS_12787 [Plasmopara halstedii]CEG42519.1 hypothetical protein PHALS_12787 [Plasmopara halstedii]|eukprot:XP_024578888.1 hypothetical protein PHALS_12787 [Plasmopara halstedii]